MDKTSRKSFLAFLCAVIATPGLLVHLSELAKPSFKAMENTAPAELTALATESRVGQIIVIIVLLQTFTTVLFAARVYSRSRILHFWGLDDTLLTLAWIASVVLTIIGVVLTTCGTGRHAFTLSENDITKTDKLNYISNLVYVLILALTKLSICVSYLRIFGPKQGSRFPILSCMTFICVCLTFLELEGLFQCWPIYRSWDLSPATQLNGSCIDIRVTFYAQAGFSITSNVWLLIIALPRVVSLDLPWRQKIAPLSLVSLGLLVIAASLGRVLRLAAISNVTGAVDISWDAYEVVIWSSVEVHVGIFCTSTLALRPLLQRFLPRGIYMPQQPFFGSAGLKIYENGILIRSFSKVDPADQDVKVLQNNRRPSFPSIWGTLKTNSVRIESKVTDVKN